MQRIKIRNTNGVLEEVDLVNYFNVKEINRDFIIFSRGELIKDGLSKVYVSEVIQDGPGKYKLAGITDESVWDKVKSAMREIVQGE